MDLFGRYTGGRHDRDPVAASYTFARHGSTLAGLKRFCTSLLARFVRIVTLGARRPQTIPLTGRFARTTALVARRPVTTALVARRPVTTALGARLGEC